ncbi:MAG: C40 family peptidase [Jatrophihabitans sp.]
MRPTVTRAPGRHIRRVLAAVLSVGLLVGLSGVVSGAPAVAASPQSHDPQGWVWWVKPVGNGIQMKGWAFDPDSPGTNATVVGMIDGKTVAASVQTNQADASTTAKYHAGATPVFVLTVPVPAGNHTVCAVIKNSGAAGLDLVRSCTPTPWGTRLSPAQVATHSPTGMITSSWANATSLHFRGWADDPDDLARPLLVVLYVDGSPVITVPTLQFAPPRPAGSGAMSRFDILVPSSVATHIGCIWVVNVGLGTNKQLGCRALDNRSPLNATPPLTSAPALNAKVLALAIKQIGKPYVYGAAGPASFDCSGLVMWTYGSYGYQTPRVSQDQRKVARLIPAFHAQPGDLVFYNDAVGDVYHVGIYQKPGASVAAIEPGRGVDYQQLWDSTLTYGSFTHT